MGQDHLDILLSSLFLPLAVEVTVQGSMTDLSAFTDASFDLIVHPISNCFIPDVNPVWREAYRVLRPGGALLVGMVNPLLYALEDERLVIRHAIPYADAEQSSAEEQQNVLLKGRRSSLVTP